VTTPTRFGRLARRRAAAALAAALVSAVGLLVGLGQSAADAGLPARSVVAAAAPATTASPAGVSLTVNPASGLTPTGGSIQVIGSGFKTTRGLYVAICRADGKAPGSLTDCVGGAIPDANTSTSWGHVTADGMQPTGGGPVPAKWVDGGKFAVKLTLPPSGAASDALDCSKVACAVYTTPDAGKDRTQQLSVALTYQWVGSSVSHSSVTDSSVSDSSVLNSSVASSSKASTSVPGSSVSNLSVSNSSVLNSSVASSSIGGSAGSASSAVSSSPASSAQVPTASSSPLSSAQVVTSTIRSVATTVPPKFVRADPVAVGASQEVLFAGFAKGETVTVTLYSAPRSLPATKADPDGIVKIDFKIPADLAVGTHLLRVVGQTSKVTGTASFQVAAAAVFGTPVTTSSALPSSTVGTVSGVGAVGTVSTVSTVGTVSTAKASPGASTGASASSPAGAPVPAPPIAPSAPVSSAAVPVSAASSSGSRPVWPWYLLGLALLLLIGLAALLLRRRSKRMATQMRDQEWLFEERALAEHQAADADAPSTYLDPLPFRRAPGYTGFHPGEHGLLSGRENPDNPGLLAGHGYRQGDAVGDPPATYVPPVPGSTNDRGATGDSPTTVIPPDGRPAPPAEAGDGVDPRTSSGRPDFDDEAEGDAGGPPGRHRR